MKKDLKEHFEPLLTLAFCLLAYVPTFLWMKVRWLARDSYYSHGFLIPFIVGWLIWRKRDELLKLPPSSHPLGIPLIITGLLIHILSSVLRVYFTSGFSFLLTIIGIILHFYGLNILKKISFPVFFLVFMIPLPEVVVVNISFRMKMFAAAISANIIKGIGIFAIREGSVIRMPHAYVVVDDVCSGLRSLISLTALGSIFAYLFKAPMWKRIILFLSTIPIAIITNVIRVVFLAFVAEVWGHEAATGFVHDFSGYAIFAMAFLLLLLTAKILE
ncbi:MAG: exosortase/archaeosortase family protein [Candidatus Omnitrophota bacterium]